MGLVAPPGSAIVALPPEPVGPPRFLLGAGCPPSFRREGRPAASVPIPYPALRLGELVPRTTMPFYTGGSGTANHIWRMKREEAGVLPFDPTRGARPFVYAAGPADRIFQRLPIRGGADGMIFALPASPRLARIAALALTLRARPAAPPTLRALGGGSASREGCRAEPVDIYASRMTAGELRRLFARGGCGWTGVAGCARPRGRVLFVRAANWAETGFEHRWIDYDLLGAR